jgi:transcription elongation factor GreA
MHHVDQAHLTPAEYEHYRGQLSELLRVRHRDLPPLLRQARGFVASDASEEIAQIQDDVAVIDARIARLTRLLGDARVLDGSHAPVDRVVPGRLVDVRYPRTGAEACYVVGGAPDAGDARTVSARSPVGQSLLGRSPGDVVEVELPSGRIEQLEILRVTAVDAPGAVR